MIETLLSFDRPGEGHGFAIDAAGELGQWANYVSIVGNETGRLDEDAEDLAQLRYVDGGDHAADGIEVFIGETGAGFVYKKTKEGARGESDPCLCCV